jgi:hypothetical protein
MDLPLDVWNDIISELINPKYPLYYIDAPFELYFMAFVSKAHYNIVKPVIAGCMKKKMRLASYGNNNLHLCAYLARNGYLSCLKYAHESGCKWRASSSCTRADAHGTT